MSSTKQENSVLQCTVKTLTKIRVSEQLLELEERLEERIANLEIGKTVHVF